MSTVRFNRLKNPAGTEGVDTTYLVNGSAKAWANLNGAGVIALRDSFNVASVVDNATGNYDFNQTTAFVSASNASVTTSCSFNLPISANRDVNAQAGHETALRINYNCYGTGQTDMTFCLMAALGDLA